MSRDDSDLKRRKFIKILGAAVATSPLLTLVGCSGDGSSGGGSSSSSSSSSGSTSSSSSSSTSSSSSSGNIGSNEWASGGTASLQASFPPEDPFTSGLGNLCEVTRSYTLGPCYFNPDEYRQDISEGEVGVPMILVLKLVDESCEPISGADIDIWHCDRRGIYSADSQGSSDSGSFNSGFCSGGDSLAMESRWFRGVQPTDENGLVFFKTCFPGWYPGRTTHIHFKVVQNGVQSLVSQFCFEDQLSNDIFLGHSDYTGQQKDTTNANDNVFGQDVEDYEIVVERAYDNSMLAYKAIMLT